MTSADVTAGRSASASRSTCSAGSFTRGSRSAPASSAGTSTSGRGRSRSTGHHTGWHDVRLVPDLGTLRPAAWLGTHGDLPRRFRRDAFDDARRWRRARSCGGRSSAWRPPASPRRSRASSSSRCTTGAPTRAARTATRRSSPPRSRGPTTIQAGDRHEGFFSGWSALAASELGPWTSQVEWGLGQWEINLGIATMADRHLLFKLAMRTWPRTPAWRSRSWRGRSPTRPARPPPAPVAGRRRRPQRLPRRGGRRGDLATLRHDRRRPAARARACSPTRRR